MCTDRDAIVTRHYNKHSEKLIKLLAYRLDNNQQDGEDVVHNAYEKALLYFGSWNPDIATFDTWFGTILINQERNFKREKRAQGMVIDKNTPLYNENGVEVMADSVIEVPDDSTCSERLQDIVGVHRFIDKQADNIREVLILYYVYQYSLSDIDSLLKVGYKKVDNIIKDFRLRAIKEKGLA